MRTAASYPAPKFRDPRDKRFVEIIKPSEFAAERAVNIMGVPFDGASLGRKGAAGGPAGIRGALRFASNYNLELGVGLRASRVFDLGDVVIESDDTNKVHKAVQGEVTAALRESSLLVILGGDNSLSLPSIRATARCFGRTGLIILDSHFDLRHPRRGVPTSGSAYGTAIRSLKEVRPENVVEIGIHGFLNSVGYAEEARKLGITVVTAEKARALGSNSAAMSAYRIASRGTDAVYLSVDLDCVDLAWISGVSAPSAGGLTANSLFEMMNLLGSMPKVVCADVVELAPSLDPTGKSEMVAATALLYLVAGFSAREKRSSRPRP